MAENIADEVREYFALHDLLEYGTRKFRRKFAAIGVGKAQFPTSHSLLLEKGKIVDIAMRIASYSSVRNDIVREGNGKITVDIDKREIEWNGDLEKVVSIVNSYKENSTVIIGVGPSPLEKKIKIAATKFLGGFCEYIEQKL